GVFVVHHEQAFFAAAVQREIVYAVMVVAHLARLSLGILAGIGLPGRLTLEQRRSPWGEWRSGVASGDADAVFGGCRNAVKAEQGAGLGGCAAASAAGTGSLRAGKKHGGTQ